MFRSVVASALQDVDHESNDASLLHRATRMRARSLSDATGKSRMRSRPNRTHSPDRRYSSAKPSDIANGQNLPTYRPDAITKQATGGRANLRRFGSTCLENHRLSKRTVGADIAPREMSGGSNVLRVTIFTSLLDS